MSPAIEISDLRYAYGNRLALQSLSLQIAAGELFAFVGPNGGGKTTLFRLLCTLMPLQQGEVSILGLSLTRQSREVRKRIGIVFQSPSLDKKLTVSENIRQQGALYGWFGKEMQRREEELLELFGLVDRRMELVETLSGGLKRRVEIAKGILHYPKLLLLDEPSTGLDPNVRGDLWRHLRQLQAAEGTTVVLTTHILEEAEKADRIAILHEGRLVALAPPDQLRSELGGDQITIQADDTAALAREIEQQFHVPVNIVEDALRLEQSAGHTWAPRLAEAFPGRIRSITIGKPTLEDVFIAKTGRTFEED